MEIPRRVMRLLLKDIEEDPLALLVMVGIVELEEGGGEPAVLVVDTDTQGADTDSKEVKVTL